MQGFKRNHIRVGTCWLLRSTICEISHRSVSYIQTRHIVGGVVGMSQMRLGSPGVLTKWLMVSVSRRMRISGVRSRIGGGITKSRPGALVVGSNKRVFWSRVICVAHIRFLGPGLSGLFL